MTPADRRQRPGQGRRAGSAAARCAPSGGCSSLRARRPSRRRSPCPGCVREVFATPEAARAPRRALLRRRAWSPWSTTGALAALTDSGHPGRPGRRCAASSTGRSRRRARRAPRLVARLRRRPRPRQRRHGGAQRRRRRRRRRGARRRRRRPLQPQDRARQRGHAFHLPVALERDPADAGAARPRRRACRCSPPTARGEVDLASGPRRPARAAPTAWLFGNEAWGLPAELAALADHRVRDPDPRPRREPQPLHRRRACASTPPPAPSGA